MVKPTFEEEPSLFLYATKRGETTRLARKLRKLGFFVETFQTSLATNATMDIFKRVRYGK